MLDRTMRTMGLWRVMPRKALLIVLAHLHLTVWAGGFSKCLIDRLPGTVNDVAAQAIMETCITRSGGGFTSDAQGSGRGFFGFSSGAECTIKKAGETRSNRAAYLISSACRKLYDEPNPFDRF